MKKLLLTTAITVTLANVPTAKAGNNDPVDFLRYYGAVSCIGESEVWYRDPIFTADSGGKETFPDKEPVNVQIVPDKDGWKVSGTYGFHIKRWKRTSAGGYPVGSVSWDEEGIWAHWVMMFGEKGKVIFQKHSRRGVEVTIATCTPALGQ